MWDQHVFSVQYMLFAYAIIIVACRNRAMYECEELPGFIRECIVRVEAMAPERIEETLMGFIRKSVYTYTVKHTLLQ